MKLHFFITVLVAWLAMGTAQAGVYNDLLVAAANDDGDKVISLLQRGMDVNTVDAEGTSLAMYAARSGNDKLLEYLLSNRANILITNSHGDAALPLAALQGHLGAVKLLVNAGAPVNPEEGWSPLQYAAFNGHQAIVAYLIEQGARIDSRAPNSMTSLMLAARNGHMAVVQMLLDSHADTELRSADGKTAADIARAAAQTEISDRLLQAKAAAQGN